jgi:hypothetical protein
VAEVKRYNGKTTSMIIIPHIQQSSLIVLFIWFTGIADGGRKTENQHAYLKNKVMKRLKTVLCTTAVHGS